MKIVPHTTCPICPLEDSIGHIMGGCSHTDMKKQYIARHDKAVRMLIKSLIKGKQGGNYIVADVGQMEQLKELGVHSKRIPSFVLPDSHMQANQGSEDHKAALTACRDPDRDKMRPDVMVVELSETERRQYLPHTADTGHTLPDLPSTLPNVHAMSGHAGCGNNRVTRNKVGTDLQTVGLLGVFSGVSATYARCLVLLALHRYQVTSRRRLLLRVWRACLPICKSQPVHPHDPSWANNVITMFAEHISWARGDGHITSVSYQLISTKTAWTARVLIHFPFSKPSIKKVSVQSHIPPGARLNSNFKATWSYASRSICHTLV